MLGFIAPIFNTLLYFPLFNLLVVIYNLLPGHDFGIAIICLTLIIRLVLYPISVKALHSQKALQNLQPKLKEIQEKYKSDKEAQAKETLALYQKEKINPFSGLFLVLIQLPILIALYNVFWKGLRPEELSRALYGFVQNPGVLNPMFLGLVDLAQASVWFAVIAGIVQYFQTKMLLPKLENTKKGENDFQSVMQKQMVYVFPVITVIILLKLPAALGLYWVASGVFSIVQQYYILKRIPS